MALTSKQRKFAYLVATGLSKTASYTQAYNSHGNANTQEKNGCVLSKQPAIAAAIAEYEEQLLALADARAEKLHRARILLQKALAPCFKRLDSPRRSFLERVLPFGAKRGRTV